MRKRLIIFIPILVVLIILAALFLPDYLRQPAWRERLDQYLLLQHEAGEPSFQVVSSVKASQPANFTTSMSAESFSDSAVFETSQTTQAQYSASLLPLPYPPQEIWCVLLRGDTLQQVVFVARHDSLYNADWIVHIPPQTWESPVLQTSLSKIGCLFD